MLRRTLLLSFCISLLLTGLWGYFFVYLTPQDLLAYQKLEAKKQELSKTTHLGTTQQNRHGVLKEIYLTEEGSRLHYRIQSVSSFLTLVPRSGKFDLYEKLENIDCWLQDKLYYEAISHLPMQQIKHMKAKEGTYRYNTQQFVAGSVDLSLYRVRGSELVIPKTPPFMYGVADSVSFAVSGKNPEFQAHRFTALLGPVQGD